MILIIDHYDSFVYSLARYLRELGAETQVRRQDAITVDEVVALGPSHVVLSPGPGTPAQAGVSVDLVRRLGGTLPILGVCLGHQCIAAAYGAEIVRAHRPMHGKAAAIHHDGRGIFDGLPNPFRAARYHSLAVRRETLPATLRVTATAEDGEIMGLAHVEHPAIGVQFHPESVLTEHGHELLGRFLGERIVEGGGGWWRMVKDGGGYFDNLHNLRAPPPPSITFPLSSPSAPVATGAWR